jgi:hypothetical protein
MDEQQLRERLAQLDADYLDDRVKRCMQIDPLTYRPALPDLLWEYTVEAGRLYINGHFMGVILFCAALAEIVLADQLKRKLEPTGTVPKELDDMTKLAWQYGIVNDDEKSQVDSLRKLRNDLIHVNVGMLTKRANQTPASWGVGLFLVPPWESGIQPTALTQLTNIRNLAIRLYGWTEEQVATVEGRA